MYCEDCGAKLKNDSRFCDKCGKSTDRTVRLKEDRKKIGKWSWGAFGLTWIYLFRMQDKTWWVYLLIVIVTNGMTVSENESLVLLGSLAQLATMIYLGFTGRLIAYDHYNWDNDKHFFRAQRIWDGWGIVFLALIIFYTIGTA